MRVATPCSMLGGGGVKSLLPAASGFIHEGNVRMVPRLLYEVHAWCAWYLGVVYGCTPFLVQLPRDVNATLQ